MTNKTQRLIEKCANYRPLEGRVLVEPMTLFITKTIGTVSEPILDDEGKEVLLDNGIPEMKMIEGEIKVNKRHQRAIVLQLPEDENRFKVGDVIIYEIGGLSEFDLIRGVSIIRKYNVVAVA